MVHNNIRGNKFELFLAGTNISFVEGYSQNATIIYAVTN